MNSLKQLKNNFKTLKEQVNNIDEKNINQNELEQFARNKEAMSYIESYINLLNEKLLPNAFFYDTQNCFMDWDNTTSRLTELIDFALIKLAQYSNVYIPKNLAQLTISEMINSYNSSIKNALDDINLQQVKDDEKYIAKYKKEIENIKNESSSQKEKLNEYYNEIENFRNILFEEREDSNISTEQEIENFRNKISQDVENTTKLITENSNKIEKINKFYIKIFGELKDDNTRGGGLEQKLDNLFAELAKYEENMKTRFDQYNKEIKGLYEKATNGSLAASYEEQRKSIDKQIWKWNTGFVLSIFMVVIVAVWAFYGVNEILSQDISATITQLAEMKGQINQTYHVSILPRDKIYIILFGFLSKITISLPFIWLAIFCTNRRKEAMRLTQEYAHKVAVTSSYASYKEQIENLKEENPELMPKLMSSTIDIISKNPVDFMDKMPKDNKDISLEDMMKKIKDLPNEFKDMLSNLAKGADK
ncbi:hypothetical protein [Campylobacter sp. RM16192]|uniref:hypothetical protein n=1 Tax=Campylobacter sp. RM16192 TaxID=1660080 RepID=UPI0014524471|nr:hypothetical protein [Campylobacter sp. RM16192]QCD51959.1 putative membrane protein [Campylobacter sp. RM16192]